MLYVLARSLAGGKREGVLSALGTFLGGMVHVFAAALGVSVILARSALAFSTVKYVGAAYLCFLGVRMILDARKPEKFSTNDVPAATGVSPRNPLWQGVATEVLNPKTALFFLSFIPQFVNRESGNMFLQFILLGTVSVALNTTADLIVILLAWPLGRKIRSFGNIPPLAENTHWGHDDRTGNVLSCQRKQVGAGDSPISFLQLQNLVCVVIGRITSHREPLDRQFEFDRNRR